MQRIVASITSLDQHLEALEANSDVWRPDACPQCRGTRLWSHGCYHRKADRGVGGKQSRNPVAVPRYLCRGCMCTCSRLPLCIAPRRWFDWAMQQTVLALLLAGCSVHRCARCTCRARRTVRRWRDWLGQRGETFAFCLRSRFAELGRSAEGDSLWRNVLDSMGLAQAMAWLDRELIVP